MSLQISHKPHWVLRALEQPVHKLINTEEEVLINRQTNAYAGINRD